VFRQGRISTRLVSPTVFRHEDERAAPAKGTFRVRPGMDPGSLSRRERVRVRGNRTSGPPRQLQTHGTLKPDESSGTAGGFPTKMNRRQFLKGAAGAISVAAPLLIPASALARAGRLPPSERIVMGSIGVGTMGFGDMSACMSVPETQIVAVCDVKRAMRERAKQAVDARYGNTDCVVYDDFRELLDRSDIDALTIAALESWHVLHALAAVRAGKDIYLEKPLGMSIHESQVLRDAVHGYGRVFQLAWCAFHLQRKPRWDPAQELFSNDPAANRKLPGPCVRRGVCKRRPTGCHDLVVEAPKLSVNEVAGAQARPGTASHLFILDWSSPCRHHPAMKLS
jgi:hypothetical protein